MKTLPADVVASVFANQEMYLVLANYGRGAVTIETANAYVPMAHLLAVPEKHWNLEGRSLDILRLSRA